LEQFFHESLSNSFTETSEPDIIKCLKKLKILHVYGQIAPLKWQDSEQGIDYRPQISEALLQKTAANIKTIYEQKKSPELKEAIVLLAQADEIFFLGFGYASENMEVLKLPEVIPPGEGGIYGTAYGLYDAEIKRISNRIFKGLKLDRLGNKYDYRIKIENKDCLELLRNYLE
jgi:hypothetical protein